jgi:hypothetical protein
MDGLRDTALVSPPVLMRDAPRAVRPCDQAIVEEHCGRLFIACRPNIAYTRPQPPLLGESAAWAEHRRRGVITLDLVGEQHVSVDRRDQGLEQRAGYSTPVRQGGAVQIDAFARDDLTLSIQQKMIRVLGRQYMGEQSGAGQSALDRPARRTRLHDLLAAHTGELRSHVPDYLVAGRHVLDISEMSSPSRRSYPPHEDQTHVASCMRSRRKN